MPFGLGRSNELLSERKMGNKRTKRKENEEMELRARKKKTLAKNHREANDQASTIFDTTYIGIAL